MIHLTTLSFALLVLFFSGIQSTGIHPKFRRIFMEKSFDESIGKCRYFDRFYEEGQIIVPDEECQYLCTCYVSEQYEGFLCEPLCPRYIDDSCIPGWKNVLQMVPAGPPEFGCICLEHKCVPAGIKAFVPH